MTLRLQFYPYTFVRVVTMKSMLYKREEYERLIKMSLSEIARTMQESDYKKEIDALALQYTGVELLERALAQNFTRSMQKLLRISPPDLQVVIEHYLKRYEVFAIKTLMRALFSSKLSAEKAKSLVAPLTKKHAEQIQALALHTDLSQFLKGTGYLTPEHIKQASLAFTQKQSLSLAEDLLDSAYYQHIFSFADQLSSESVGFKQLLQYELDMHMISMIARAKKQQLALAHILSGKILKEAQLPHIQKLSYEQFLTFLEKTELKALIQKIKKLPEEKQLSALDTALKSYVLRKNALLMHQHPLSIDVILGYMLAKEAEIQNLQLLIKGKELGLKDAFIEEHLATA